MSHESERDGAPTRRTVLGYGAAAVGGASLAGCSGTSRDSGSTGATDGATSAGESTATDTAVENGDVYRAGSLYRGPITNLVLTERTARQLYGVEGELFDRDRVAAVVAGEV